jgi:hypothetical protein
MTSWSVSPSRRGSQGVGTVKGWEWFDLVGRLAGVSYMDRVVIGN